MEKISAVYKIVNEVTGDFYIGSSVDVKRRWGQHRCPYVWKVNPNKKLYQDMHKFGIDKFKFEIVVSIMPECLKRVEQDCIELMNPTYNNYYATGVDFERYKDTLKKSHNEYYKKNMKACRKQLCNYNGEILTFCALEHRLYRAGIKNAVSEAKKYLI